MVTAANELRIGNIVKDWLDKRPFPLSAYIIKAKDILEIDTDSDREMDYEGYPLTPEIMEKCGFELFPWGWVKKSSKDFGVRLNVRSYYYEVSGNNPVKIQYLHQLQNLFFALTGEELPVKL